MKILPSLITKKTVMFWWVHWIWISNILVGLIFEWSLEKLRWVDLFTSRFLQAAHLQALDCTSRFNRKLRVTTICDPTIHSKQIQLTRTFVIQSQYWVISNCWTIQRCSEYVNEQYNEIYKIDELSENLKISFDSKITQYVSLRKIERTKSFKINTNCYFIHTSTVLLS